MPDHARSTDPAVQAQLDRLSLLGPGADILGLDRITRLLSRLGDPHRALPPVFHVAGTNGKGSTCAYLRAALEAEGHRVHVFTSPHLVRYNERIRVAGRLIDDVMLADLLDEVLSAGGEVGASFFEVTTAVAFLAFARVPADACVVEVGLGGRLDATNVLVDPVACGIAQLGVDHEAFLGSDIVGIAREKAGIAKPGVPLVSLSYPPAVADAVAAIAEERGAPLVVEDDDWHVGSDDTRMVYRDGGGSIATPLPRLPGPHQRRNLALAIAMLRHQEAVTASQEACARAAIEIRWPARMQRLGPGPLTSALGDGTALWLDGGHNPGAGEAIAGALASLGIDRCRCIVGMLANKDPAGLLAPLAPAIETLVAVPVPGHDAHPPARLVELARELGIASAATAPDLADAIAIASDRDTGSPVLIIGSLYLAGEALRLNDEPPD